VDRVPAAEQARHHGLGDAGGQASGYNRVGGAASVLEDLRSGVGCGGMARGDGSHDLSVIRLPILENMRKLWWLVIGGGVVLAGLLVVLGFAVFGGGGSNGSDAADEPCEPAEAAPSAGNANVRARALGNGFMREIVIRLTDKQSGEPVQGAQVTVRGTMDCLPSGTPHFMPLYEKKLRETATGTYKGDYQLIMQGTWTFNVVVRSELSGSTTASFPVIVANSG
jgi:hypothetical protein